MKNKFAIVIAILLIICSAFNVAACDKPSSEGHSKTNDELYSYAVRDAMIIDDDEILPLVNISRDDDNVIWHEEKVLVAFMHKYPDSYPAGADITLQWGNVWCVSAAEMYKWVKTNGQGITDWSLRLHQVLGMPTSKNYTTITALWIDASLLYRPANITDANSPMAKTYQATGNETFDNTYKKWFDSNIIWSYFDSAYPWTRLGYTYDWADNGTEYGLSEFLIFQGASATIAYTYSIEDYIAFVNNACDGNSNAKFKYQHDPRENPSAMVDIVEDENAIYGFRPSETGSLKMYADADWSDPQVVEQGRQDRIAYHNSLESMYDVLDEMKAQAKSTEEIARTISNMRNQIRLDAYKDDPGGLGALKQRNLERYGHEEGPLPDELYEQYGSWEVVIAKAFSTNSGMDACLGLYDDYYNLYVAVGQIPAA